MSPDVQPLEELARLYDVGLSYEDVFGEVHHAEPEVLLAVLRELGAPIESPADAPQAVEHFRRQRDGQLVPPVIVAWEGHPPAVPVRVPKDLETAPVEMRLELESGAEQTRKIAPEETPVERDLGHGFVQRRLEGVEGAEALPSGYHRLEVRVGSHRGETLLISAPRQAFQRPGRRWGIFLPLYSLVTDRQKGPVASYEDLARLARWAKERGASLVGTLPLLAGFLRSGDAPFDISPYAPASRLFWNELYVEPKQMPESGERADPGTPVDLLDVGRAMARRRELLEEEARRDYDEEAVAKLLKLRPAARDYALFRAYGELRGEPWLHWPEAQRNGLLDQAAVDAESLRYHLYVQLRAEEQIARLRDRDLASLYLDLPLGVHADSFDVWRDRTLYARGASAGAPPDLLFRGGQDWGFPPLIPERLRQAVHRPWIEAVRHHARACNVLRIDHVMQIHRLYWVPRGFQPTQGVYVHYPAEELLAVLVLESHREQVEVIGEDLGTVPGAVRDLMDDHGLSGMHVSLFETDEPKPGSLACLDTHDTPTFRAYWEERDLPLRRELGLLDEEAGEREKEDREAWRQALRAHLDDLEPEDRPDPGDPDEWRAVMEEVLRHLARSEAGVVLVNVEDLWGEIVPQNVPGTATERPNWRRRASKSFEEFTDDPEISRLLEMVDRERRQP